MGIVQNDFEIDPEAPFENDELDREETAGKLTSLILGLDSPLVLSINGRWGTGKTTFIKMWNHMLENQGVAKSLRFNAWENDFASDPAVVFIDEMAKAIEDDDDLSADGGVDVDKLRSVGKRVIPLLLELTVGPRAASLAETGVDAADNLYENFEDAKSQIHEFREELADVAEQVQDKTSAPLVVFVDELDRCRPDFAVELLERIKHLFDVSGIMFILAMDAEQLESSVRSLYGQDMDAEGYLRRFIDLRFQLPQPEGTEYLQFLLEKNGTDQLLGGNLGKWARRMSNACADGYNMSLRDKEQYMLRLDLTLRQLAEEPRVNLGIPSIAVPFLIALRMERKSLYQRIVRRKKKEEVIKEVVKSASTFGRGRGGISFHYGAKEYKPEHLLEGVVRTMYYDDYKDFDREKKLISNKVEDYSDTDLWDGKESERQEKEEWAIGVDNAFRIIKENGGVMLGNQIEAAIELSGAIEAV